MALSRTFFLMAQLMEQMYFKGEWNTKFEFSMTRNHDFHLLNGTSIRVPFVASKRKQFINVFDTFKVLGLPYKQGKDQRQFSMYLFLPHAKGGLSALIELITKSPECLEYKLPYEEVEVGDFRIPKFKFSFDFEASHILKELRVVLPFSHSADLTKMADSSEGRVLYVSEIFQKSFIEINEEGTEAVAASVARACVIPMGLPTQVYYCVEVHTSGDAENHYKRAHSPHQDSRVHTKTYYTKTPRQSEPIDDG